MIIQGAVLSRVNSYQVAMEFQHLQINCTFVFFSTEQSIYVYINNCDFLESIACIL